jgi:hypothetical protein
VKVCWCVGMRGRQITSFIFTHSFVSAIWVSSQRKWVYCCIFIYRFTFSLSLPIANLTPPMIDDRFDLSSLSSLTCRCCISFLYSPSRSSSVILSFPLFLFFLVMPGSRCCSPCLSAAPIDMHVAILSPTAFNAPFRGYDRSPFLGGRPCLCSRFSIKLCSYRKTLPSTTTSSRTVQHKVNINPICKVPAIKMTLPKKNSPQINAI